MNKFKAGDKVRYIGKDSHGLYVQSGKTYTVEFCEEFCEEFVRLVEISKVHSYLPESFELVQEDEKESIARFLREEKWFIRTGSVEKSKLVQEWLFEHGMEWYSGDKKFIAYGEEYLSSPQPNRADFGTNTVYCVKETDCQEIKLQFETIIKNVQLPEIAPKKTEAQIKLEQLQKIIEDAQSKIAQIKEEISE